MSIDNTSKEVIVALADINANELGTSGQPKNSDYKSDTDFTAWLCISADCMWVDTGDARYPSSDTYEAVAVSTPFPW